MNLARVLIPTDIKAPARLPRGEVFKLSGQCMGTLWSVQVVLDNAASSAALRAKIAARLEDIEAQMSHFRPSSALSQFSQAPAASWHTLPADFDCVMHAALDITRRSAGAFDPCLAAAIEAWGFGPGLGFDQPGFQPPEGTPLQPNSAAWRTLQRNDQGAWWQPGGLRLNLAAIAKGYAVDAVSHLLSELDLANHLVEVGGELRGRGLKPSGQPWWVALEAPAADCGLPPTRIALHNLAVASSGNYRRRYTHAGQSLQHSLDPRNGRPLSAGLAAVSVLHEQAMYADAWATAIMVKGPQAGLALAVEQGLRAHLQWQDGDGHWQEASSPALLAMAH